MKFWVDVVIPDGVIETKSLDELNSFIIGHTSPEFVVDFGGVRRPGGVRLFWIWPSLVSIFRELFVVGYLVDVVAPGAIGTESFDGEVYAGFSFVILSEMYFFPDFLIGVSKGALTRVYITLSRKGQYPFSCKYLHFWVN